MSDDAEKATEIRFSPPVYVQRYDKVIEVLQDARWKGIIQKAVDFGCAELKFFRCLKQVPGLTTILEVDVDENVLSDGLHIIEPTITDFIRTRSEPLEVFALKGSVCQPDYRLIGCDAVIGIELIEHLYPGPLERLPHNIFRFIEPLLAIFTTPNQDFNKHFADFEPGKFRHYDHKFEWSKIQFKNWAQNITERYPNYTVEFHDIGFGPEETRTSGGCSQMAVFIHENYNKKTDVIDSNDVSIRPIRVNAEDDMIPPTWDNKNWDDFGELCDFYKLIKRSEYPFWVDNRTEGEKILAEALSSVHFLQDDCYYDFNRFCWKIPLSQLTNDSSEIPLLREALRTTEYEVENDHLILKETENDEFSESSHSENDRIITKLNGFANSDDVWHSDFDDDQAQVELA